MLLKKMVDEYEEIRGKINEAQKQFGNQHHLVVEYQKQLDDFCTRYYGICKPDSRLNKSRKLN